MGCIESKNNIDAPVDYSQLDQVQTFEFQLPFKRTMIHEFETSLKKDAEGDALTRDQLVHAVKGIKNWGEIEKADSLISRFLADPSFASDDDSAKVSIEKIMCFAVVQCAGPSKEKAAAFYRIFQDSDMPHIAASDKDIESNFPNVVLFNSNLVMDWATKENKIDQPDSDTKEKWEDAAKGKMLDDFLDGVFGNDSKVKKEVFISKCASKEMAYIFDSSMLRQKTKEALQDE